MDARELVQMCRERAEQDQARLDAELDAMRQEARASRAGVDAVQATIANNLAQEAERERQMLADLTTVLRGLRSR